MVASQQSDGEFASNQWKHTYEQSSMPLLGDSRDAFRPRSRDIPALPGVYKWRDEQHRVIYVGKAKNLRDRLANYFQPLSQLHPRTRAMVLAARSLEWTVVATELEALTLEYTWIKAFEPRFNIVFRDDKTYPYLAVSVSETVPRVWITRNRHDRHAQYFGPFAKVLPLRHSLDTLLKTFPVRTCSQATFMRAQRTGRPCLLASIGKCSAPCVGRITPQVHREQMKQLVGIMTGAIGTSYVAQLTNDMKHAAAALEFEKAAQLRDQITSLNVIMQQNAVALDEHVEADVFGLASDDQEASVHAFFVRSGMICGERNWGVERTEYVDDAQLLEMLLVRVYAPYHDQSSQLHDDDWQNIQVEHYRDAFHQPHQPALSATDALERAKATKMRQRRQETTGRQDFLTPISPIPREIIVPVVLPEDRREQLEHWLSDARGSKVSIRVAERGDKRALLDRAIQNAVQALQRMKASHLSNLQMRTDAMNEIAEYLGLESAPLRIECYDISNTVDGSYQVASMVVLEDGLAKPNAYRRFSIRGNNGKGQLDDLSALYETITRRFQHDAETEHAKQMSATRRAQHFAYQPQLLIVDGGREQALAAQRAMQDCGVDDVPVCGLAKKMEEVWLPDEEYPLILPRNSQGLYLLQRARDEAHRFAIAYHRAKRRKGTLRSELDTIAGIGDSYKKRLLKVFGSVAKIREASVQALQTVPGIGSHKAQAIYDALHDRNAHNCD